MHVIAMGCDIAGVPELVYADGLDLKAARAAFRDLKKATNRRHFRRRRVLQ